MEISANDVAERLGLTESQVCRLIRSGKIKARKMGYMWLIDENDLNYRRNRRQKVRRIK
jgi:excisionase family DNA binding protein